MKTALITGITGQDGAYLARLLLDQGYNVIGGYRRSSSLNLWRLRALGIAEHDIVLEPLELLEDGNVRRLIDRVKPDEVYNLAAQSFVASSFDQPEYTLQTNAAGVLRLLEALRGSRSRFYQASTSEMFGSSDAPQSEKTPFNPRSPYGIAKLAAHWLTVNYRQAHGLHASCGILFNHESPLRGPEFVTQKIAQGLARIKAGDQELLTLGNLDAWRDWGFAGDYVQGMWQMLQQEEADDYVLATGRMATVRSFVNLISEALDMPLSWEGEGVDEVARWRDAVVIRISRKLYRPAEVDILCGDHTKAKQSLGWEPTTSLPQLALMMAKAAYDNTTRTEAKRLLKSVG